MRKGGAMFDKLLFNIRKKRAIAATLRKADRLEKLARTDKDAPPGINMARIIGAIQLRNQARLIASASFTVSRSGSELPCGAVVVHINKPE